jgi:hypothetical protein
VPLPQDERERARALSEVRIERRARMIEWLNGRADRAAAAAAAGN